MTTIDDVLRGIEADREDIVRGALEAGMDVNSRGTIRGRASLLTLALLEIRPSIVRLLLEAGAGVEIPDGRARLPLACILSANGEIARKQGYSFDEVERLIQALVDRGARFTTKDPDGIPAWISAQSSRESMRYIRAWALRETGGEIKKAAKLLGMTARQWDWIDSDQAAWRARGSPSTG